MTFFVVTFVVFAFVLVAFYTHTQFNQKALEHFDVTKDNKDDQLPPPNLPSAYSWPMVRPNKFLKVLYGDPHDNGIPKSVYDSHYTLKKANTPYGNTFFSNDGSRYGVVSDSSISIHDVSHKLLHTIPNPNSTQQKKQGRGPYGDGGLILSNNDVVLCRSERHVKNTRSQSQHSGNGCEYHNTIDVYTESLRYKKSIGVIGVNARLVSVQYHNGVWYTCFLYENELSSDPVHLAVCEMYTPSPITELDVRERLSIDINQESSNSNELDPEYEMDVLVDTNLDSDGVTSTIDQTERNEGGGVGFFGSRSYGADIVSDRIRDREQDPIVLLPTKWTIRRRYEIKTSKIPLSVNDNGIRSIRVFIDINHRTMYVTNSDGLVGSFYLNRFSPTMHLRSIHELL